MDNSVKEIRLSLMLSPDVMASKIGLSTSHYYKIEQGERNPSFGFLKKLKAAFPEVDINPIFEAKHQN